MFETGGSRDAMEKVLWQKYVLCFAAGSFVTMLIFNLFLMPSAKRAAAESAEKEAQQKFSADLARNPLEARLASTKAALQAASQERDACKSRFDRQTILYDSTIPIDPGRVWIIPADVVPIVVGDHSVTFTHYDAKAKRETGTSIRSANSRCSSFINLVMNTRASRARSVATSYHCRPTRSCGSRRRKK